MDHFKSMKAKVSRKDVAIRLMKGETTLREETTENALLLYGY